ncbi:hypothetical protein SAMN02745673_00048 [Marinactinospora thermotolerans DSM 45154]|uniref:Guanylate cyclase n=1 Tax=Marinactinospora thermotolerans DSM 45154 TaxID=1122192 RepID=A0A1T4JXX9_9ACTN|nr:hypothetical protein SAMN02745673_00048 [Marinactinospora thermotolerans DSM 45154]
MTETHISLDEAVDLTRTGDVWVFRGRTVPDRAIQVTTNSPVNHVGMSVVIEDLPPLMWHAELGRSLPDMWSGTHQRGVQLHDLRDAVVTWGARYGQRAWLRQLDPSATREAEDAVLRTIARLDGTPFPSTARLAGRWLRGRVPLPPRRGRGGAGERRLETAYCAEVVALTYEAMGLLPGGRRPNWYDPGRFWSGDDLDLVGGHRLGGEIAVDIPEEALAGRTRPAAERSRPRLRLPRLPRAVRLPPLPWRRGD